MSSQMLDDIAEQERLKDCLCSVVKVGGRPTVNRNWNPSCPVHPKVPIARCMTCGVPGAYHCTLGDRCENKLKMEGKEY